ncbi:hypothetical protein EI94DRAFT_1698580 [Lactarius quietus]|nr:hypothetical protein EI94DRAFT_1698580 [Lactarius quietus]
MLFHRSLISFAVAMALAALNSGVTASAILERRAVTCAPGTGNLMCCSAASKFTQLQSGEQNVVIASDPNVNKSQIVGTQCEPSDGSQWYCNPRVLYSFRRLTGRSSTNALCCNGALNQFGSDHVSDNCITLAL